MTKKQKEFMAKAVPRTHNEFTSIYIADTGKKHESGWNKFVVIGNYNDESLELITEWSDVVDIYEHTELCFEIVEGFIHIWKHNEKPFVFDTMVISTCDVNGREHWERVLGVYYG